MKQRMLKSLCVFTLLLAMLVTSSGLSNVALAASKKKVPKLSTKSVTLTEGKSKKVTVKNKPAKAKLKWSSKNKKIAKVSQAGKIKAVKKGNTKVTCKVTYKNGKKKVTKNLSLSVKVKAAKKNTTTNPVTNPTASVATPSPTPVPTLGINASNLTTAHKSKNGIDTRDNGMMRTQFSSLDLIKGDMGYGWNLGNQMEQSNWQKTMDSVTACETSAGNPAATQLTFDGLKSYGVKTVRVPVAWSNFMSEDGKYTISEELFDRVEEIINYALNDEMYVIINIHWDGGWWGMFGAEEYDAAETPIRDEAWKKYIAIWTQISERYKEYSDHLIFEGANEELSGRLNDDYTNPNSAQFGQTGKFGKDMDDIYKMIAEINQKFVDIVRASGGNNKYRHLLIPGTGNESCVIDGYENDEYIGKATIDDRFIMPTDPAEAETGVKKQSISVHYYDPTSYGISATSTTAWGYRDSWGVDWVDKDGVEHKGQEDYDYMAEMLGKMKKFTDAGYGIIIGECGCVKGYKDNVTDYMKELFLQSKERGMCPVWWDEGHYYNREGGYFSYDDVGKVYAELTGSTPEIPANAELQYTGIKVVPVESNKNPKVVAAWEGEFMRHTNEDAAKILEVERAGDWDPTNYGIGKTTALIDSDGNVTTGEDAKAQYNEIFASWWKPENDKIAAGGKANIPFTYTNSTTGLDGSWPDKMIAEIDREYWNIHFKVDWTKIEKPCVRVYPADNETSQGADLQLGYLDEWTAKDIDPSVTDQKVVDRNIKNGAVPGKCKGKIYNDVDYDQGTGSFWVDQYVSVDKEQLLKYPWLWVTTNTYVGASYVKIEICDAAYNADGTPYEEPQE